MQRKELTVAERERGWIAYECPVHGFAVAGPPNLIVTCQCGRKTRRVLNGRVLDSRDIDRMVRARKQPQKPLQIGGSVSTVATLTPRDGFRGLHLVPERGM